MYSLPAYVPLRLHLAVERRLPPRTVAKPVSKRSRKRRPAAERASVGLGAVYRHSPQRSDLIMAVFQIQVDACAHAASALAGKYEPGEALAY
jgi:hypothetical protein